VAGADLRLSLKTSSNTRPMVTADNLNLDVLELIFAFISGNDLVAVSSVSKSFLAGVIPCLYATVSFTAKHAKRYRPDSEGGVGGTFVKRRDSYNYASDDITIPYPSQSP
jgi:hypothetical protein